MQALKLTSVQAAKAAKAVSEIVGPSKAMSQATCGQSMNTYHDGMAVQAVNSCARAVSQPGTT